MKSAECGTRSAECGPSHTDFRASRLILLLAVLAAAMCVGLCGLDRAVATAVLEHVPDWVRDTAAVWGWFGSSGCYLVPTGILLVWWWRFHPRRDLQRICIWLLAAEAAGGLVSRLIKIVCGRWRPNQIPHGYFGFEWLSFNFKCNSFPSGHATDAAVVATVLWFVYPRLRPLYVTWVVLMAAARVLSLDHFVADVAAGAAIGLICALVARRWLASSRAGFSDRF